MLGVGEYAKTLSELYEVILQTEGGLIYTPDTTGYHTLLELHHSGELSTHGLCIIHMGENFLLIEN